MNCDNVCNRSQSYLVFVLIKQIIYSLFSVQNTDQAFTMTIFYRLLAFLLFLMLSALSTASTEITGKVTRINGNEVKVEYPVHAFALPKVSDSVAFSVQIDGFKVKAGKGKVTKVNDHSVWIKVTVNPVDLDMDASINATDTIKNKSDKTSSVHIQDSSNNLRTDVINELMDLHLIRTTNINNDQLNEAISMFKMMNGYSAIKPGINDELLDALRSMPR